jgi:branched-chain amino acid transport system permease protein
MNKQLFARSTRPAAVILLLAFAFSIPKLNLGTAGILPGQLNSPGSLQILALMCVFGALALSYDVLFGITGVMSFGHALFFAIAAYMPALAMNTWHWGFYQAVALGIILPPFVALVVGAIANRVSGIAFAMVTLAFAQAASIVISDNILPVFGAEQGLTLPSGNLPSPMVGIFNVQYRYWLCLIVLIIVALLVAWVTSSNAGRVWHAIREKELRVSVLGLQPYWHKLGAFVFASFLAGLCGVAYVITTGIADPSITLATFTLSLLLMVVIGGSGRISGAILGGLLYEYLSQRLAGLADTPAITRLPSLLSVPFQQPTFTLGVLFILIVFFAPGGLIRIPERIRSRRRRDSADDTDEYEPLPEVADSERIGGAP